jgi:hypothetical protein
MFVAVWLLGLLALGLWSLTMWAAWLGWSYLATLPWSQATEAARASELPPWLEIWLGGAWREWLEAAAPMVEWVMRMLEGSAGWLQGLLPVLFWGLWAIGALGILVATALAAGAIGWWRRRSRRRPAV